MLLQLEGLLLRLLVLPRLQQLLIRTVTVQTHQLQIGIGLHLRMVQQFLQNLILHDQFRRQFRSLKVGVWLD